MTTATAAADLATRAEAYSWDRVRRGLDADGHALLRGLLTAGECTEVTAMAGRPELFRSHVVMAPLSFGEGEYWYFADPLPAPVAALREALYPPLATVAAAWARLLGEEPPPPTLSGLRERCRAAGQTRPTSLLLRYQEGGYNRLHQDIYGDVVFPLQVVVALTEEGVDHEGGELLLVEQRPRQQSIGHVVRPRRGDAVVLATRHRPVTGARGAYRAQLRHGVSRVRSGCRLSLGIIFHNAA